MTALWLLLCLWCAVAGWVIGGGLRALWPEEDQ
jgi:hypothetical protein